MVVFERRHLLLDRLVFGLFVRGTELITEWLTRCHDLAQRGCYGVDSLLDGRGLRAVRPSVACGPSPGGSGGCGGTGGECEEGNRPAPASRTTAAACFPFLQPGLFIESYGVPT